MRKMASLPLLKTYGDRLLTDAEIQLLSFYENKAKEKKRVVDDKLAERLLLSETLHKSSLIVVVKKKKADVAPTTAGETADALDDTYKNIDKVTIKMLEASNEVESSGNEEMRGDSINNKKLTSISSSEIDRLLNSSVTILPFEPLASREESLQVVETAVSVADTTDVSSNQGYQRIKKRQRSSGGDDDDDGRGDVVIGAVAAAAGVADAGASQLVNELKPETSKLLSLLSSSSSSLQTLSDSDWDPRTSSDYTSKEFILDNFGYHANQTLIVRVTVPPTSRRWSLNICPFEYRDECDILFHFNPRYLGSKKSSAADAIINDKQGTWGMGIKSSLSGAGTEATAMLTDSVSGIAPGAHNVELIVQIRRQGFCVFVNGRFGFYFPHRRDPTVYRKLRLTLPSKDDTGKSEEIIFHNIYWGNRNDLPIPLPKMLAVLQRNKSCAYDPATAVVTSFPPSAFARSVGLRGLPLVSDPMEVYELELAIKELFVKYAAETTSIAPGKGTGFVRLESPEAVLNAIDELNGSIFEEGGKRITLALSQPPDII